MPSSYARVYLHFVWATWDREPIITRAIASTVRACIRAKAEELRCQLLGNGGMPDHVHLLLRAPATVCPADLAHDMKGASSHLANETLSLDAPFRWQGSYGVMSVSPGDVSRIRAYIRNQASHHRSNTLDSDLERCFEEETPD